MTGAVNPSRRGPPWSSPSRPPAVVRAPRPPRAWRPTARPGSPSPPPAPRPRVPSCLRLRTAPSPAGTVPCDVARDGRLPHPLARSDHGERGNLDRVKIHRVEAEVRADVRDAGGEGAAREQEAPLGPEHRLVRQVDDELRPREALLERVDERHADVEAV